MSSDITSIANVLLQNVPTLARLFTVQMKTLINATFMLTASAIIRLLARILSPSLQQLALFSSIPKNFLGMAC